MIIIRDLSRNEYTISVKLCLILEEEINKNRRIIAILPPELGLWPARIILEAADEV